MSRLASNTQFFIIFAMTCTALVLVACFDGDKSEQVAISPGQAIWQKNCAVCHQQGLAGSPMIGNKKQWLPRLTKGMPLLFEHAINGYSGETGEMPPKGGNEMLTDGEVKQAVTYMVSKVKPQ